MAKWNRVGAGVLAAALLGWAAAARGGDFASLPGAETEVGYLARLLINEAAFPGERGYVSEADTRATMLSVLWVLHARAHWVPSGYKQEEIAGVRSESILDFVTARNQCEGFSKGADGKRTVAPRVEERIRYLLAIANRGKGPGRFAGLIGYARELAEAYFSAGVSEEDLFAGLKVVEGVAVTGRAYSWMTGMDAYHPGGNFVRIPDEDRGLLGGNRFFTLRKEPKK